MRISTTENYFHLYGCNFDDCERFYCPEHRLLWRFCDTARGGIEGDNDVINGTRVVYDAGDCPQCEATEKRKRLYRELVARYPHSSICPDCFKSSAKADDTAAHLITDHEWDYEKARLWLRSQIERGAFNEPE
jgi:hypothetical protein